MFDILRLVQLVSRDPSFGGREGARRRRRTEGNNDDIVEDVTTDDAVVLAQLRADDEHSARAAFDALFLEYHDALVGWARRLVDSDAAAADLVADVFVGLWVRRRQLTLRGNLRSYLYGAVRLKAIDHIRHQRVAREAVVSAEYDHHTTYGMGVAPPSPDWSTSAEELARAVRAAITALPERCRLVITLRWEHNLSTSDVAAALGVSTKTVENQITIAYRTLRQSLERFR